METSTTPTGASSTANVFLYLLAMYVVPSCFSIVLSPKVRSSSVLPPLAVFLDSACSVDFIINILLTILGWIPGILHAWYTISKRERRNAAVASTAAPAAPVAPVGATKAAAAPVSATGPATMTAPGTAAATY
ncbi:uncharacterized protein FOMMEDRAFT_152964 [Fomitiporia mediterranea MF3/22]|uniref:uncharacterized protein n=1 Tax=Fomitiporia mediterranea (strain MF3/22) TaxID=694068 RepID=UPI0004407296|nr:uncharacterized protein FOMMEDRAFT_152964 [Fomitiporia mediterranea MF3/22]EJD05635.1 hypothetical protein FOMMEDRAFT_152964 [Fomitiporia mediterranea MF3/22]